MEPLEIDIDSDDEELVETPPDVTMVLGFDPATDQEFLEIAGIKKFDPAQAHDESGKRTKTGKSWKRV